THIDFLGNLLEAEASFVDITFAANWVDRELVQRFTALTKKFKGDKPLIVNIVTSAEKSPIKLRSQTYKMKLTKGLLTELYALQPLSLRVRPEDSRFRKIYSKKVEEDEVLELIED